MFVPRADRLRAGALEGVFDRLGLADRDIGHLFRPSSHPRQAISPDTNGSLLCSLGSLTNEASATVTMTLAAQSPGTVTNVAFVTHSELDKNPLNDSASAGAAVTAIPMLTIRDSAVTQNPSFKTTISFSLNLSLPSSVPVSVAYQTADGTALSGQDYDSASGVITFSPFI